jgi:hypothetical protein
MRLSLALLGVLSFSACDLQDAVKIDSIYFEDGINPGDDDTAEDTDSDNLPPGYDEPPTPEPFGDGVWTDRPCYPDPEEEGDIPTGSWVFECLDASCPPNVFEAYNLYTDGQWRLRSGEGSHADPTLYGFGSLEPTIDCAVWEYDSTP